MTDTIDVAALVERKAFDLAESIAIDQIEVRAATNLTDAWYGVTEANAAEIMEFARNYAATVLQSQADALAEARRVLIAIDRIIGGSIKENGDEKFTLNINGEKYEGPAVEFLGYALTSIQGIARAALAKEGK